MKISDVLDDMEVISDIAKMAMSESIVMASAAQGAISESNTAHDEFALHAAAIQVWKALSDPIRIKMLRILKRSLEPINVNHMATLTNTTPSNTSRHLTCLAKARLVMVEQRAQSVYYWTKKVR